VTHSWIKPLLIPTLAATMLVGCTDLPIVEKPPIADAEQKAVTAASVKEFLSEIKQLLASVRSVNGASAAAASALAGYRVSGYAVATSENPWEWQITTLEDGTLSKTRHVIETVGGETVTDIQSTRLEKTTDGVTTYTQEDVVTRSAIMLPGTYKITGTTTMSGEFSQPNFKAESTQTTTFTPASGAARTITLKSTYTPSSSVLTVTGTLPDGATISYKSTQSGAFDNGMPKDLKTTQDMSFTSVSGKTLVVENALDNLYSRSETKSSVDSKGFYQVSLGNVMKVRFDIDVFSEGGFVPGENGGGQYVYSYPRNNVTAGLLDGTGKRIAPIALETTSDHSKPPTKGTLTLEGESPSELDLSFMMDIMRVQMSLPFMVF